MKGIIWYYKNTKQAKELLKDMIKNYEQMGIKLGSSHFACRESKHEMHVELDNGDIWKVLPVTEQRRGEKCNISYISRTIPKKIVRVLIMPCTMAYPYQGISYWYEEPVVEPNANV